MPCHSRPRAQQCPFEITSFAAHFGAAAAAGGAVAVAADAAGSAGDAEADGDVEAESAGGSRGTSALGGGGLVAAWLVVSSGAGSLFLCGGGVALMYQITSPIETTPAPAPM